MSSRRRVKTRTQRCDAAQARKRLADARLFLELAETVDEAGGPEWLSVSAANAVLAGIAAADAACCRALGERSRGEDHRDEAVIDVRVFQPSAIARVDQFVMRKAKLPTRRKRCIPPGATRPGKC